ncbi:protein SLOW GREEN 1, chloroplastic [Lycium ferocissimum]|uniref:protein SLOW GREEN 1, chloroplastic n=1 Tax=Lycium ferocissimum TaxID=112874 RepID=UPI0028155203|nr:protein SLOW GREEN 1, chloroplastic [Lycium ferocissimum]
MNSTLTMASSSLFQSINNSRPSIFPFPKTVTKTYNKKYVLKASSSKNNANLTSNPLLSTLKSASIAVVFAAVALRKFPVTPLARAETPPAVIEEQQQEEEEGESPLTQFLESNSEAIQTLKNLLQEKLEAGEDEESLKILRKLSSAQPENTEWKFLTARLLNEMGKVLEAREVFEEILSITPLSFEALFENALLMDRCGEGVKVLQRLEEALRIAEEENKVKEGRDVRFIMAQVQFLQKNVEEALRNYDELEKEDPKDFRPYFCKGMIYSLLDRNKEAREQFAKYRELSPKKFEVEGYLRTALSRMKLFGTDEKES